MMRFRLFLLAGALLAAPVLCAGSGFAANSGAKGSAQAGAEAPPASAEAQLAKSTAEQIDDLFNMLSKTHDSNEAAGLVTAIDRLNLISGSDTSDLLMSRAMQAMDGQNYGLALKLLDSLIDLRPQWAEAWNKRATARYLNGDVAGAMTDIAQTLKKDPRNIGALAGLGTILFDADRPEDALRAYDRALALAPEYEPLRDAESRVKAVLSGRTL